MKTLSDITTINPAPVENTETIVEEIISLIKAGTEQTEQAAIHRINCTEAKILETPILYKNSNDLAYCTQKVSILDSTIQQHSLPVIKALIERGISIHTRVFDLWIDDSIQSSENLTADDLEIGRLLLDAIIRAFHANNRVLPVNKHSC